MIRIAMFTKAEELDALARWAAKAQLDTQKLSWRLQVSIGARKPLHEPRKHLHL
jgi:hypothetical protein